jgi:ribosomal protein S18 acetylase RimI-like enzyme
MTASVATYIVEDAGQVLGTYYIKTNQPGGGAHICNCGYIAAPDARGRGLAATMCEASQDQAKALGYSAMQFNFVLESNAGAVRLWHRLGFTTVGTIPNAFDHPTDGMVAAFVMYKALA